MAQGTKHWIQALLNDDSYVPIRFFSDVTAWSNPLLMGVEGGAVETRTPPAGLEPATAPDLGSAPAGPAAAYAFPTDSTGALALIGELLRAGVEVRRDGARAIVAGSADLTVLRAAAERLQVPVSGLDADPGGGGAARQPHGGPALGGQHRGRRGDEPGLDALRAAEAARAAGDGRDAGPGGRRRARARRTWWSSPTPRAPSRCRRRCWRRSRR